MTSQIPLVIDNKKTTTELEKKMYYREVDWSPKQRRDPVHRSYRVVRPTVDETPMGPVSACLGLVLSSKQGVPWNSKRSEKKRR